MNADQPHILNMHIHTDQWTAHAAVSSNPTHGIRKSMFGREIKVALVWKGQNCAKFASCLNFFPIAKAAGDYSEQNELKASGVNNLRITYLFGSAELHHRG